VRFEKIIAKLAQNNIVIDEAYSVKNSIITNKINSCKNETISDTIDTNIF